MVILSQDKTQIINFDNIVYLWIQNPLENDNAEFEIIAETDGISTGIGFYKTEARAKEVLESIAVAHSDFKYYAAEQGKHKTEIGINIYQRYKSIELYEMPKE